jgi:hypothetical protein
MTIPDDVEWEDAALLPSMETGLFLIISLGMITHGCLVFGISDE